MFSTTGCRIVFVIVELESKLGVVLYLLYFRLENEENVLMQEKGLLKQIEDVVKRTKHSFFDNTIEQCKQMSYAKRMKHFLKKLNH